MAVETILFLSGKLSTLNTAAAITDEQVTTASGYASENLREANYINAWKPTDSAGDHFVEIDTGAVVGTNGQVAYAVLAYDAAGCDQTAIRLVGDDTGAGPWTARATFTLNTTGPTVDWQTFTLDATPDRHFRIEQLDSSRGAGNKTAKIFYCDVFLPSGYIKVESDYTPTQGSGPGYLNQVASVASLITSGGFPFTNCMTKPRQEIDLTFRPADSDLWEDLRDQFHALNGMHKAFPIQFQGLKNAALANFQLVRIAGNKWSSQRVYRDIYETSIPLITEPHF